MENKKPHISIREAIRTEVMNSDRVSGKRSYRAVGMYSIAKDCSTPGYSDTGVLEHLYVEPAFHKKGIAKMLTGAALAWSRLHGRSRLVDS